MAVAKGEMESLIEFEEKTGVDPEVKLDKVWNKMLMSLKKKRKKEFVSRSMDAEAYVTIMFGKRSRELSKIEDLFKGARRVVLNSGWWSMAFDMLDDIKSILYERGILVSKMI